MKKIPTTSSDSKRTITLSAHAKINFNLKVLGKRPDGFHELETVMQSIALKDTISIQLDPNLTETPVCLLSDRFITARPTGNIAYKAADKFLKHFGLSASITIRIEKKIPVAAGLAGGSSDAAAVLKGLFLLSQNADNKELFDGTKLLPQDFEELLPIAAEIGSDVPFCLLGGTALCQGKGEIITPLSHLENLPLLIYNPGLPIYTKEAFAALNAKPITEATLKSHKEDSGDFIVETEKNTQKNDLQYSRIREKKALFYQDLLTKAFSTNKKTENPPTQLRQNDFTDYILQTYPQLADVQQALVEGGSNFVSFTGSGPTIFAFFTSFAARDAAYDKINGQFPGDFFATYTI